MVTSEDIKYFVQSEIVSARFLIAILVIVGYIAGKINENTAGYIIAFYFGSNGTSQILKKLDV
jgi:hypothetical protein